MTKPLFVIAAIIVASMLIVPTVSSAAALCDLRCVIAA
jgi:hypothetical protein